MGKTGIIIANTGTPDAPTPEAVESYLRQFLMHKRIRPMPSILWGVILEGFILPVRKRASADKYSRIWTQDGSPLSGFQHSLAEKLQLSLVERGLDVCVISAMSFGRPSLENAVATLESNGCESLVVVPLYPQYAYSNGGIVEHDMHALEDNHPLARGAVFVKDYWRCEAYLDAIVDSVSEAGFNTAQDDFLILSYHSIPRADITHGDIYDVTTRKTTEEIAKRLEIGPDRYGLCYQSRFDKGRKWLDPFLGETVKASASDPGKRRVFVVTPGFAIDCLETLYDIDIVLREDFLILRSSLGDAEASESFIYIDCLNDSDKHVKVCEAVLMPYLT